MAGGIFGGAGVRGGGAAIMVAAVLWWAAGRGWWRRLGHSVRASSIKSSPHDGASASAESGNATRAKGVPASEWENLSEEERQAWRQLREAEKTASKVRLQEAIDASSPSEWRGAGLEIVFDLSYGASSTDKMNRSLAKQLAYAYSYAKNTTDSFAPAMHITSYLDEAKVALEKRGAGSWLVHKHPGALRDVFCERLDDLIYLSPDGEETLEELTPGKVYVIGGIVDRTVSKGMSLEESSGRRSGGSCIPAMRLPIDENIPRSFQGRGHVLNINTVAHILMAFKQRGNWEEAIVEVMHAEAPARFRETIPQDRRALVDGSRPPPQIPKKESSGS
jgi:tRNA (guanine9-N1)-methyltransferase